MRSVTLRQPPSPLLQEIELDLANPAALGGWLETETLARFIDGAHTVLLINNAGMLQPVGRIEGQDVSAIRRAVSLNVAAPSGLSAAVAAAGDFRSTDRTYLERRSA